MSGETGIPYEIGTPEYDQFVRGTMRAVPLIAGNLANGQLAQWLPPPAGVGAEKGEIGLVSELHSTVGAIPSIAQTVAGTPSAEQYKVPGAERAAELHASSQQWADDLIPHVQPQNEDEEIAANFGKTLGSFGIGAPVKLLAKLPGALSAAINFAVMGPHAIKPAIAVGTAADIIKQKAEEANQVDLTQPPAGFASETPTASPAAPHSVGLISPANAAPPVTDPVAEKDVGDEVDLTKPASTSAQQQQDVDLTQPSTVQPSLTQEPPQEIDLTQHQEVTPTSALDPTSWSIGKALTVVAGTIGAGGAAIYFHGKVAPSFKAGRYVEASRIYNDRAAVLGDNRPPELQAPVPGVDLGTRFNQAQLDAQAPAKAYLETAAQNPTIGRQNSALYGDLTSNALNLERYRAAADSGDFHNVKLPPINDWFRDAAALPDDVRELVERTMKRGDELDNRRLNIADLKATGKPFTELESRFNDPHLSTDQITQDFKDGMANPVVKEMVDRRTIMTDGQADAMGLHGLMTPSAVADLKAAHRVMVSAADLEGVITNPLRMRNRTPGTGNVTDHINVWENASQHDLAVYKAINQTYADRLIVDTGLTHQASPLQGGVMPAKLITESKDAQGNPAPPNARNHISVRMNGVLRHFPINNDNLLQVVKGSPLQTSASLVGINKFRQINQSFITGAGAVVSGHVFPVISAIRNPGEIAVMRSKGFYGTHLEKLTGIAGDPITPYLGAGQRAVRDVASVLSKSVATALDPRSPIGARFESVFGKTGAAWIRQRAQNAYDTSNLAAMREQGLSRTGGYNAKDTLTGKSMQIPSRDMVPELFRMNDWGGTMPTVVKLRNLFDEMRTVINDAGHNNYFALNKDNPRFTPAQIRAEVRNVTGNPETHGSEASARGLSAAIPFHNIARQELAAVVSRFSTDPLGVTMRFMTHYGVLAAASVYTAMLAGPDAIKHLFDSTNDQERSKEFRFYVPGYPTTPITVPVMIEMRPAMNFMTQLLYDGFGLMNHERDGDLASRAQQFFSELFSKHVWKSTAYGTLAGVSGGLPPLMPAGGNAVMGPLTGHTADPTLYNTVVNWGKPIAQMFSRDVSGGRTSMPGAPHKVDPVTGSANGEILEHFFSDVLGVGGHVIYDTWRQYANAVSHNLPLSNVLDNFKAGYAQRLSDDLPGANLVWGNNIRQSAFTPLQQRVDDALDKMRPTLSYKSDLNSYGLTRSKFGLELPEAGSQQVPQDETMQDMYVTTAQTMAQLQKGHDSPLSTISDIRKQMNSLDRSPLSPDTVRGLRNDYIKQLNEQYEQVQAVIHDLNTDLSTMAGAPVDIRHINWSKGPEQFSARPATATGSPAP